VCRNRSRSEKVLKCQNTKEKLSHHEFSRRDLFNVLCCAMSKAEYIVTFVSVTSGNQLIFSQLAENIK
jgi:hypothetical protein